MKVVITTTMDYELRLQLEKFAKEHNMKFAQIFDEAIRQYLINEGGK